MYRSLKEKDLLDLESWWQRRLQRRRKTAEKEYQEWMTSDGMLQLDGQKGLWKTLRKDDQPLLVE